MTVDEEFEGRIVVFGVLEKAIARERKSHQTGQQSFFYLFFLAVSEFVHLVFETNMVKFWFFRH